MTLIPTMFHPNIWKYRSQFSTTEVDEMFNGYYRYNL